VRYGYVYAIALHSTGKRAEALAALRALGQRRLEAAAGQTRRRELIDVKPALLDLDQSTAVPASNLPDCACVRRRTEEIPRKG
jgi:hypothetical protein